MLFGLFKRDISDVEEYDEVTSSNSEADSPRKRLSASINEVEPHNPDTVCGAGNSEDSHVVRKTLQDQRREKAERKRKLRAKLKEVEETIARVKKEGERDIAVIQTLKEKTMVCMICRDVIQDPQVLQCGHSACYVCLRSWWTQPLPHTDHLEMIDTVAESDLDDVEITEPDATEDDRTVVPRVRRRHKFRSAVKRKRFCPYCNQRVTSRPWPDIRTRDIVETLQSDLVSVPQNIQARREARRKDIWHGIFEPEEVNPVAGPVAPSPPHPGPIPNHVAQAQFRRAAEDAVARQVREWDRAFEHGRRLGMIETTLQLRGEELAHLAIRQP